MIYINTFLYYTLFSSIVLFYGIGLNQLSEIGNKDSRQFLFFFKSTLSIFTTAILTYLIVAFILVPLELVELFPFICLLIFIAFNSFAEGLIRLTTGSATTEFIISFLIILVSIYQSNSILDTLVICLSCICGLALILPFIHVLRNRIIINGHEYFEKYICILSVFLAILLVIISVFDISWLNGGMIK
ncbi:MAG: hypothetical protein K5786_06375 [Treponema sp.]|nr:hypothetical protein [Treponema sp.]